MRSFISLARADENAVRVKRREREIIVAENLDNFFFIKFLQNIVRSCW